MSSLACLHLLASLAVSSFASHSISSLGPPCGQAAVTGAGWTRSEFADRTVLPIEWPRVGQAHCDEDLTIARLSSKLFRKFPKSQKFSSSYSSFVRPKMISRSALLSDLSTFLFTLLGDHFQLIRPVRRIVRICRKKSCEAKSFKPHNHAA